jgi:hypothetical protein
MNRRKAISILRKAMRFDIFDGKSRAERVSRRVIFLLLVLVIGMLSGHLYKAQQELKEPRTTIIVVPEEQETEELVEVDKIKQYIDSYGGRINDEYLATLRNYCDEETLKLVVAISVAETNMGNSTLRHSNFYGYFYGGNRNYDPDYTEMSEVICRGISKYYSDVASNRAKAVRYTGGDNVDMWIANVNKALSNM